MSDEQRAEVGTIYRHQSRFEARRIGAAYITRNVGKYLATHFDDKTKDYHPLLYCWRGGMRSQAIATILSAVGWRVGVLQGGYRAWRRDVVTKLREAGPDFRFLLIDGQTGTSKTEVLELLAEDGCQTLDLERLADHRGSVFGGFTDRQQPSQKQFESRVWYELSTLDEKKPIIVEAESAKIGRCALPDRVLHSMRSAARIELRANVHARAKKLVRSYSDLLDKPDRLACAIQRLGAYHSQQQIELWLDLATDRNYETLAAELMERHYDPRYERQRRKRNDDPVKVINLPSLDKPDLDIAAQDIAAFANDHPEIVKLP